jgi:hypothetical protein
MTEYKNKIVFFEPERQRQKEKTEAKKHKISKIVKPHFFLFNELENAKKIKRIHGYKNHFYLFETAEKMQLSAMDDEDEYFNLNKKIKHDEDILLKFEDRQLIYLEGYLKTLTSSKKYVLKLVEFYMHLLGSLKLLNDVHLLHGNILLKNIVIDKNEDVLLCNFSHSFDLRRQDASEHLVPFLKENDNLDIKPLEWHVLHYLSLNKKLGLSNYNMEKLVDTYLEKNELLHHFGNDVLLQFRQDAVAYLYSFTNKTYDEACKDLLKHADTWNNFELSMVYLKILVGIQRVIKEPNVFVIRFAKLLVENISSIPDKRHSLSTTMELFHEMMSVVKMEDYMKLVISLDNV